MEGGSEGKVCPCDSCTLPAAPPAFPNPVQTQLQLAPSPLRGWNRRPQTSERSAGQKPDLDLATGPSRFFAVSPMSCPSAPR